MAQLPSGFKAGEHKDMLDFSPVPTADYMMIIKKSEMKMTKKAKDSGNPNDGQMLVLQPEILEGEYKGKIVWLNLNLINPDATTVKIANETLATLCRACGKQAIQDSQELHGIPFIGKVKYVNGTKGNPDSNKFQGFESADGYVPKKQHKVEDDPDQPKTEPKKKKRMWD